MNTTKLTKTFYFFYSCTLKRTFFNFFLDNYWTIYRIEMIWSWISLNHGNKITLPLTIPRHIFKSSANDFTRCSVGIVLQNGPRRSFTPRAWPTARSSGTSWPLLQVECFHSKTLWKIQQHKEKEFLANKRRN
jgi:hypothetical protein